MGRSIIVEVVPNVLKWLRESSGYTIDEVAKRLKTKKEIVIEFEEGKRYPRLAQLKEMSRLFKRPLSAFLLSEPKGEKFPKDYRMLPAEEKRSFDKKTILAIRRAQYLQEIIRTIFINMEYKIKVPFEKVDINDSPIKLSKEYRVKFNLSENKQKKFRDSYKFFKYLRNKLESLNIFVFQFSMPLEDARGFTLVDDLPYIIVVNSRDNVEARIFTLMHEFAHVLLRESVVDIPKFLIDDKIENWCNLFAANLLFPKEIANKLFKNDISVNKISKIYHLSKNMIMYNKYKLGYASKDDYLNFIEKFDKISKKEEVHYPMTSDKKCIYELGNKAIYVITSGYEKGYITFIDVLNYLSIKSKHFDKLQIKVS